MSQICSLTSLSSIGRVLTFWDESRTYKVDSDGVEVVGCEVVLLEVSPTTYDILHHHTRLPNSRIPDHDQLDEFITE